MLLAHFYFIKVFEVERRMFKMVIYTQGPDPWVKMYGGEF